MPRVLIAFILCAIGGALATTVDYAIGWDLVPSTAPAQVTTRSGDFGSCMCDVTDDCDANCCCDPQCNSNELNVMFTSCDKEVAGTDQVVMCSSRNSGTKIVRSTQEIEYTTPTAVDAVCVVNKGIPADFSPYFNLPSVATVGAMVAPTTPTWPIPTASASVGSTFFAVGSKLPYLKATQGSSTWTVATEYNGYFFDPRPTGRGRLCTNDKLTTFMNDHDPEQCAYHGTLAQLCASTLDASQNKFYALTLPSGSIVSGLVGMRHVVVDTDGNNIEAPIDPTITFTQALGLSTSRRALATSGTASLDSSGTVCHNALISRQVQITYTTSAGGASLFNATVTYTLGDVAANSANLYWVTYSTQFARSDLTGATAVPLRNSNGGYEQGNPVLAGRFTVNGAKQAVVPRVAGLTIPSGRLCSDQRQLGVRFGHNVQSAGCFVNLTQAQLVTLCAATDGTSPLLQQAMTPVGTGSNVTYVLDRLGFIANANYASPNDWVTVQNMPWVVSTTPSYDSRSRTCSNLVTGLRWVIGVSQAGVQFNPQDVITGARLETILGSWQFKGSGSTSLFRMSFEVAFVRVDATLDARPVVPPNILPEVDQDVFFPFRRASDQTQDTTP